MKLLAIHSDFIEFKAKKKAFKKAEEDVSKEVERVEECLVIFTAAESSDEAGAAKVLENYVAEVKSISEQVNCNKIVLYPYAHLSSDLSNPSFALKIMQDAEKELKKSKDYEVYRAPFGWYKSFNISCKGHPLSELSRKIGCEDKKSSLKREYKDEVFAFEAKELDSSDKIKMRAALVLAAVVKKLYPKSEISDCGFYHDQVYLDISGIKLQENNFGALKKQMRKLISAGDKIKKVVSSKVANDLQKDILSDIGKDGVAYGLGDVTIVSRFLGSLSGAVDSIGAFELVSLGSVYWKGNQENKQHMRIRLVAFSDKKGLDDWKQALKEAEDRSHLKIGKEMGLFVQSKLVGSGLPLIAPKGMVIRSEVVDFLWELHKLKGYKRVWTPTLQRKICIKLVGIGTNLEMNCLKLKVRLKSLL